MIFRPAQLGMAKLDRLELEQDKKACRKIGPCGVGKKALYLNSFYIDRRYYLPYGSISRVFKRVAMSSGGFTGKGMFASMAYLVVEYDGGKQKQCNFKDERAYLVYIRDAGRGQDAFTCFHPATVAPYRIDFPVVCQEAKRLC